MSVARIKTIVIVALALVNAFFMTIIAVDNYSSARSERQAIESVCSILQSNGIRIDPDSIKTAGALRTMRTTRDIALEESIALVFLGEADITVQSLIYRYENPDRGYAEFSSGGNFEIQLNAGVITDTDGTLRTVQKVVRDMRLETSAPVLSLSPEAEIVSVLSRHKGTDIFNCSIEFFFVGGNLQTVRGRYVAGAEPIEDSAGISNVGTALLGMLADVVKGDIECEEIIGVEAGYQHSVVGSFGEGVLTPSWLIITPSESFFVR